MIYYGVMKTLVIINGVTGAIGSACLAQFSREPNTNIIGLSRQAQNADVFCVDGFLPNNTLICSIGDISSITDCENFVEKINRKFYGKIVYVHAVGIYPFELDGKGNIFVSNDDDGDGVDDRVVKFSHTAFFAIVQALKILELPISALIFGGIADKFKPAVHKSWWTVMEMIKARMQKELLQNKLVSFFVLNISSVICPHEVITRPFVFQKTNADAQFWLMPHEVAERVQLLLLAKSSGFLETEFFHDADYYEDDHFAEKKFTQRKKDELGI